MYHLICRRLQQKPSLQQPQQQQQQRQQQQQQQQQQKAAVLCSLPKSNSTEKSNLKQDRENCPELTRKRKPLLRRLQNRHPTTIALKTNLFVWTEDALIGTRDATRLQTVLMPLMNLTVVS